MKDFIIKNLSNEFADIKVELGKDIPLWVYVKKALQDIEILNILSLYKTDEGTTPFIHIINFKWDPHPPLDEIQDRRRETGTKIKTKSTKPSRLGILYFDIYIGARDKYGNLDTQVVPAKMYIPIEDEHGRYLLDDIKYTQFQLVDKLLYPTKDGGRVFKSLLPIVIKKKPVKEVSVTSGYIVDGDVCDIQIFKTMENALPCFMHIPCVLSYLEVFPLLQFAPRIADDVEDYEYFKPVEEYEIYVKAYRKAIDKPEFSYVRNILVMACKMIRTYEPETYENMMNPNWWIWRLSYYPEFIEQRGACHQMHVARMLDTSSALNLPIPEVDKRTMTTFLKYILQSNFDKVDIFCAENKRFRLNEAIATIVTAEISAKLKGLFKFGSLLKLSDLEPKTKMKSRLILNNLHKVEIVQSIDFANDFDFCENLKYTTAGPNSLGNTDKRRISNAHRQLAPSFIGYIDLFATSKDVGQTGMISPHADLSDMQKIDVNKYPSIKFELYKFIDAEFPGSKALTFNANSLEEYNQILDNLTTHSTIDMTYTPNRGTKVVTQAELEEKENKKKNKNK